MTSAPLIRVKHDLPPTPPLPASLQTLVCRWRPLALFDWCRRRIGDRFTLYCLDLPPVVFLSNPTDIRAVLTAPASVLRPGAGGSAIAPIVGAHSFMLHDADEHMRGRRTILPCFSASAMEEHAHRVARVVQSEIASWPLDTPFSAFPRLRSMSLRIILETVFQVEARRLSRLHHYMLRMLAVTDSFVLVEPRLRHLPPWRGIWRRFLHERARVDAEILSVIEQAPTSSNDVLDRLRAATNHDGSPLSFAQLRDNLVSVMLAGHETTASEATWALQLIAHSPLAQARLTEELDEGSTDRYLQATVAEVLRHRPVFVFAIPRVVAAPFELGGWIFEPPVQLLACMYLLHHDPTLYPRPDEFLPERFLTRTPEPHAWLPWGGGRKRCPGHRLATLELEGVIRATLAERTLSPASRRVERAQWRSVIVTPVNGGRVILSARRSSRHIR